jgi:hypothetical protein
MGTTFVVEEQGSHTWKSTIMLDEEWGAPLNNDNQFNQLTRLDSSLK